MAIDVKIPPMGESITSGVLAKWHVKDGEVVKKDQALFELETDKITSEGVAESDGVIHISVEAGSEVKIGQVIATIDASAAAAKPAPSASAAAPIENPKSKIENPSAAAKQTRKKMSPLRAKIAQRLVAAQHEAAMLTTFNEVDMSGVMALRAKYQDDFVKSNGVKLGFMSFFTKAVVQALRDVPAINAQIEASRLSQRP